MTILDRIADHLGYVRKPEAPQGNVTVIGHTEPVLDADGYAAVYGSHEANAQRMLENFRLAGAEVLMRTVHKQAVALTAGTQQVQLPADARVVRVCEQHGTPTIWYETDTDETKVMIHQMRIIGTGDRVPDRWVYLGTADIGPFVFHLYEARIPGRTYSD